jgi:uncharacterized protein (TIGR00255 family)
MPMLLSMTGFGRGEARTEQGSLQVEIRSVNHRFSELSVRLPKGFALLEARVRERVQEHLSRGKVNVSISLDGEESEIGRLSLNREAATRYHHILRELKETFGLTGEADLASFLTLPDVLTWEREQYEEDAGWGLIAPALDAAVKDILEMKRREGETLGRDLLGRLDLMASALTRIEARVPEMVAGLRRRIVERLEEAGADLEYNRNRVETEIVLFADRTDCTEECVRLRSHLDMFRELIRAPEPAGRKLNFLLQEMNRESNTIGSKAQDIGIAREVIGLKEEIERIREQVQNFE